MKHFIDVTFYFSLVEKKGKFAETDFVCSECLYTVKFEILRTITVLVS